MRRNSGLRKKTTTSSESETDQVEQLLQASHDDVLLKLSLNSHMVSSRSLDPDLTSRFQALKSRSPAPRPSPPPSTTIRHTSPPIPPPAQVDDELKAVLGDDLSARFAALRGSLNPSSSSSSSTVLPGPSIADDEEDEVEKIIRWAKDAARLDPSPPSDEDAGDDDTDADNDDTDSDNSSHDGENILEEKAKMTRGRPRQKRNPGHK